MEAFVNPKTHDVLNHIDYLLSDSSRIIIHHNINYTVHLLVKRTTFICTIKAHNVSYPGIMDSRLKPIKHMHGMSQEKVKSLQI